MRAFSRLIFPALIALAAARPAMTDSGDPPGRVARLNYVSGSVSFQPSGTEEWVPATLNRPLTIGDALWTGSNGRAELHIGSTAIRLSSETSVVFLDLDDQAVQVRLTEGRLNIRLRQLDESEALEVDTPSSAISLLRPGEYRLEVDPGGNQTLVAVRGGEVEVSGADQAFTVHRGQQARIVGDGSLTYDITAVPRVDEFDQFCQARDRRAEKLHATKYVSPEMTGYEDLDDYGDWRPHPEFGVVWMPRTVVVGWTPYRFGHWVWIEPWGWTWVDDAPWGFAPFHYGRWVHTWGRWGWVPGPFHIRPVYAPALVVFVGGTDFWLHIGIGGGVGWFPLGPWEMYRPGFRCSRTYITNINVRNVYNVRERYVNRTVIGGVVGMPHEAFASGRRASQSAVDIPGREALNARVYDAPPVAPTIQSLGPIRRGESVPRPRASAIDRPVVARRTPPPAPIPFRERQEQLRARPGQPLDRDVAEQLRRKQAEARGPVTPRVKQIPPRQSADRIVRPEGARVPPRAGAGPNLDRQRKQEQLRRQAEADRERQQRNRQVQKDQLREERAIQDDQRRQQRSIEKQQQRSPAPRAEKAQPSRRSDR